MDLYKILQQHPEYAPDIVAWEKLFSLFSKELATISSFEDWQAFIQRHPDVSIDPDLARRIFTIQSLLDTEEEIAPDKENEKDANEEKKHVRHAGHGTPKDNKPQSEQKKEEDTEKKEGEEETLYDETEELDHITERFETATQPIDTTEIDPFANEEMDNTSEPQRELIEEEKQQQLIDVALSQSSPETAYHIPTDQLRKDPRYQALKEAIIAKKRQEWEHNHPGKHWTDAVNDPAYNRYFSPDLTDPENTQWTPEYRRSGMTVDVTKEPVTQLTKDAVAMFRLQYEQDAKAYDEAEKNRIYDDPFFDPLYKQYTQATSQAITLRIAAAKRQWEQSDRKTPIDENQIAWIERYKYTADFVRRFPKKAHAYAEKDANIKRILLHRETPERERPIQQPPTATPIRKQSLFQKMNRSLLQRRIQQQRRILAQQKTQEEEDERKEENNQQSSNRRLIEELRNQQQQAANEAQRSVERQLQESTARETPRQIPRRQPRPRPGGLVNKANKLIDTARNGRNLLNKELGGAGKNASARVGSFIARQAASMAARAAATAAAATSEFWLPVVAVIGLIILAIVVIILLLSGQGGTGTTLEDAIPNLRLQKVGPASIENKQDITYTITVDYAGPLDVTVFDPIPPNTTLASASGTFKNENNTISWRLRDNTQTVTAAGAQLYTFTITLRPLQDDIVIRNKAFARAANPSTSPPLKITQSIDKEAAALGDPITVTLTVTANALAGNLITVTNTLPPNTTLLSKDDAAQLKGNVLEWIINAEDGQTASGQHIIPPQTGRAPEGFGYPLQRASTTVEKIRQELEEHSVDPATKRNAQHIAEVIYKAGVGNGQPDQIVDPAFVLAVWYKENGYQSEDLGYPNNPGSLVWSPTNDGRWGIKRGPMLKERTWAQFDTFDEGISAIASLIRDLYYPKGQIDTWTVHSGIDEKTGLQYHGRGDIGKSYTDIASWEIYVKFYYGWIEVMDRLSGGNFRINKQLTFTIKADKDNIWLTNRAQGFAPGAGNVNSNRVIVKIGNAPESERPKTGGEPAPPPSLATLKQDIQSKFGITLNGYGNQYLVWAWERFHEVNGTNFFDLTKGTIIEVGEGQMSKQIDCPSNPNLYDVLLSPYNNERTFKAILIHELGHVIRNCNNRQTIQYLEHEQAYAKEYGVSYYANNAYDCTKSDNLSEDYADMVVYYLDPITTHQSAACATVEKSPNLQQNFPLHYNVANTVLGDYP